MYHALKDGNEFFGVFKKEKMIKNLAYVHINEKGIIKDISACKKMKKEAILNYVKIISFLNLQRSLH